MKKSLARITVEDIDRVRVVNFNDRKLLDAGTIEQFGCEIFSIVDVDGVRFLLDFKGVEFLSSAALNKLIILDKMIKARGGRLVMCHLIHEVSEVFALTRLDKLFDIRENRSDALAVMT